MRQALMASSARPVAQPCCRAPSWASLMNARSSMGVRHFTGRHRASISFNMTFATAQPFNTAAAVARRRREGCDRPPCMPGESIGPPPSDLCDERRIERFVARQRSPSLSLSSEDKASS